MKKADKEKEDEREPILAGQLQRVWEEYCEQVDLQHKQYLAAAQKQFEEILHSLQLERQKEKAEWEQQRSKWKEELETMTRIHEVQREQVKLDVGGKYYSTAISNLTKFPDSMLGAMFSGRHEIIKNDEGRVFIDRDGKLFRYILDFLRNNEWDLPHHKPHLLRKIRKEIDFYGLPYAVTNLQVVNFSLATGGDLQLSFDHPRGYEFSVTTEILLHKAEAKLVLPQGSTARAFLCLDGRRVATTETVHGGVLTSTQPHWHAMTFQPEGSVKCLAGRVYAILVESPGGEFVFSNGNNEKRTVGEVFTQVESKYLWDGGVQRNTRSTQLKLRYSQDKNDKQVA
ncbi:putative BTB/POZ domain-containing protein kctd15-like [Balamuthia mandrillaris]